MNEFIQKKCPSCGAILTIKNQEGLQNTTVTCPVCHQTYPFVNMKDLTPQGPGLNAGNAGGILKIPEQMSRYLPTVR